MSVKTTFLLNLVMSLKFCHEGYETKLINSKSAVAKY